MNSFNTITSTSFGQLELGVSSSNIQEDTMNITDYFSSKITERFGPNPEPKFDDSDDTFEPDEEYLAIDSEDVFSMLVEEGHGVRVHKTDRPWMGKLDLDPENCRHRMINQTELLEDFWLPPLERPEEFEAPVEAGPWESDYMDEFGDWYDCGYQIATHEDEYYDDTWDILADTHREEQRSLEGLGYRAENVLRMAVIAEEKEKREKRFEKILEWISTADFKKVQSQKGRLWNKVNKSRKACGEKGLWSFVYLTKKQMGAINEVLKFRTEDYWNNMGVKKSNK